MSKHSIGLPTAESMPSVGYIAPMWWDEPLHHFWPAAAPQLGIRIALKASHREPIDLIKTCYLAWLDALQQPSQCKGGKPCVKASPTQLREASYPQPAATSAERSSSVSR